MGASNFSNGVAARTAQEAFDEAVSNARWTHGHGGYTGTIAEKHDFVMVTMPAGMDVPTFERMLGDLYYVDDPGNQAEYAVKARAAFAALSASDQYLIRSAARVYNDKWGPAVCVMAGPSDTRPGLDLYHFCGWASS